MILCVGSGIFLALTWLTIDVGLPRALAGAVITMTCVAVPDYLAPQEKEYQFVIAASWRDHYRHRPLVDAPVLDTLVFLCDSIRTCRLRRSVSGALVRPTQENTDLEFFIMPGEAMAKHRVLVNREIRNCVV